MVKSAVFVAGSYQTCETTWMCRFAQAIRRCVGERGTDISQRIHSRVDLGISEHVQRRGCGQQLARATTHSACALLITSTNALDLCRTGLPPVIGIPGHLLHQAAPSSSPVPVTPRRFFLGGNQRRNRSIEVPRDEQAPGCQRRPNVEQSAPGQVLVNVATVAGLVRLAMLRRSRPVRGRRGPSWAAC
jgi:hypothetical protein